MKSPFAFAHTQASSAQAQPFLTRTFAAAAVGFASAYHDDQGILHGVCLVAPQNSMTALVGLSGSGKSTLAKLIAGFWDVKNGTITMGGHDLKEIPLDELYDQVAFVSQDNYLFDDAVRENIRMGRRNATDADVEAAVHEAGCDSFLGDLENGFDTVVGESVAHLSGGMRQDGNLIAPAAPGSVVSVRVVLGG